MVAVVGASLAEWCVVWLGLECGLMQGGDRASGRGLAWGVNYRILLSIVQFFCPNFLGKRRMCLTHGYNEHITPCMTHTETRVRIAQSKALVGARERWETGVCENVGFRVDSVCVCVHV